MSTTVYEKLLCEARPEAIETDDRYDEVSTRLAGLVRKGDRRTTHETRLMKLLAVLVEDYDRKHALPPDESTPAERLRYLLNISGKPPAVLSPIFGQRSHVNEALNGKRAISAGNARKLGVLFGVNPGFFI